MSKSIAGLVCAFSILLFLNPLAASAATWVSGEITGDVTWTKAGGPYVALSVSLPSGSSLTIEPGTVVKAPFRFSPFNVSGGTLTVGAEGGESVVITALTDDTVGGDTNEDGSDSVPHDGYWLSIGVGIGSASFTNTVIRYGGYDTSAQVANYGGQLSIHQSDLSHARKNILLQGGDTEVYDSAIHDSLEYGIYQWGDSTFRFGRNVFTNNSVDVQFGNFSGATFQNDGGNSGVGGIYFYGIDITGTATLPKDGLPYVVAGITVPDGAELHVAPGAVIKAMPGAWPFHVFGTMTLGALGGEPVTLTSFFDDTVLGDTNHDGVATTPYPGSWCAMSAVQGQLHIASAKILYGGCDVYAQLYINNATVTVADTQFFDARNLHILQDGGSLDMTGSELANVAGGVSVTGSALTYSAYIAESSFYNLGWGVSNGSSYAALDARNNWWGDASGPWHTTHTSGLGVRIYGNVLFDPWLDHDPFATCTANCFSNVLFLPGLKGSRLYMSDTDDDEDRLWLPSLYSDDVDDLNLTDKGVSKNTVYSKIGDVLEEDPLGGNIYQGFLDQLAEWKSAGTITDYDAFAYDWRLGAEDLAKHETRYSGDEMKSAVDTAVALADSAKSKKVTIVAHSYGGLFAKALMMELESRNLVSKVDKVILVGTPQMGTPLAMLSMLYGYDETMGLGALVTKADARALAEHMPSAYGLLPSQEYFSRIEDSFVTFASERTRYQDFSETYGEKIQSYGEFRDFLLGTDGRSDPAKEETELENVLTENLLNAATETHERLDNWEPPANVELIQIAGWGLDTVSGVKYTEKEKTQCFPSGKMMSCTGTGEYEPVYEPQFTVDGDKVGVTPSALMLPEADNIKRYWVNLYAYNDSFSTLDREHKDLFEVGSLQEFIEGMIENEAYDDTSLPKFIEDSRPSDFDGAAKRLRMSLYSPLDIHLYDNVGNHTGPKAVMIEGQEAIVFEENIPNSYYLQFGERKYVGFDESQPIRIEMEGYAEGSYTLKLEEVAITEAGESVEHHTTFANLPTTAETKVTLDVSETGLVDLEPLEADIDGDGEKDYEVVPVPDGVATLDPTDETAPATALLLGGTEGVSNWYTSDVIVTLTATDNENGSGVETTEYSLDDGVTWVTYTVPVTITTEGIAMLKYFSTDKAGNKEEVKMQNIQIDKVAPEGKVVFNPTTHKLDITGTDNLGGDVSVVIIEQKKDLVSTNTKLKKIKPWFEKWLKRNKKNLPDMLATLTDEAGHTTSIAFEKTKDRKGYVFVRVSSLGYDESEVQMTNALAQYQWRVDRTNLYQRFVSHLRVESSRLESRYLPRQDETWIMERPQELEDDESDDDSERPVKEKLPGLVVPGLITEQGKVKIVY